MAKGKVFVLAKNWVSIKEARRFAEYCRGRGYKVDFRESEGGVLMRSEAEWDLYERLQCDFYHKS